MIRAMVIDDEQYTLLLNKQMIEQSGEIHVIGNYMNPLEAIPYILEAQPDILFVDIEMPVMNGFQLVEKISPQLPFTDIVFITAYDQFALRAFDVQATDYLLKPLTPAQVQRVLQRFRRMRSNVLLNPFTKNISRGSIQLFGRFKIISPTGKEEVKWRSSKSEELFAFMLLQEDFIVHRDMILDQLWPDIDLATARMNLNTSIYRLKNTLLQAQMPVEVNYQNHTYRLVLGQVDCDLVNFRSELEGFKRFDFRNLDKWEQWVHTYQDEILNDRDYTWLSAYILPYMKLYQEIVTCWIDGFIQNQHMTHAEKYLTMLLNFKPYEESLYEKLLQVYMLQANRSAFVKYYQLYNKMMREEWGIEPSEQVQGWLHRMEKKQ
jgi:two-component system LytT family response regulator